MSNVCCIYFFFQAEDGIRDVAVTGVQTCALPIYDPNADAGAGPALPVDAVDATRRTCRSAQGHDCAAHVEQGHAANADRRSEERRVGKECRSRRSPYHEKKEEKTERATYSYKQEE